jgi:anti-sigma regulatory factor (Ser/Thr protein kinase)
MATGFTQEFTVEGRDFFRAGTASTEIRALLKSLGVDPVVVRRVGIAAYEAEMNVVMYAERARMIFTVTPERISLLVQDEGPGIPDVQLAMQEGWSTATREMREMGFGAGMGLPNIRKNADEFTVASEVGKGTRLDIVFRLN